jgi:hypothetical protein
MSAGGGSAIAFICGHPCASIALASLTGRASVKAGYAPVSLIASRFSVQLGKNIEAILKPTGSSKSRMTNTGVFVFCTAPPFRIGSKAMTLTVHIPDDLAAELGAGFENLNRAALEALAAEAYDKGVLSLEQVRRLLGLESRWMTQAVLSKHGSWPGHSTEEVLADEQSSAEFRQSFP